MATTIIPPASGVLAVRNRQVFQFITDNYLTTIGVQALLNKPLNTVPSDGETIIFSWDTETVTFTFKTTPAAETDIEIQGTVALQVAEIVSVLLKNYLVYTAFIVEAISTTNLRLTARNTGSFYSLTFTGTGTGNFLSGFNTAGVDEVYEEPFSFYADLYKNNVLLLQEAPKPDAEQTALYDPAEVILSGLSYTLPAYNASTVAIDTASIAQYTLKVWEYYNDAPTAGEEYTFTAHLGGLLEKETTTTDYDEVYFTSTGLQRFLTKFPRTAQGQTVVPTQQIFLYAYQKTGIGDAYVYLLIDHTDGTSIAVDPKYTISQPGDILIIPAGYTQLNIDSLKTPGKTVSAYHIQIYYGADLQSATATTEGYNFTVDHSYYPNTKAFLIGNSLGGFDSLLCTGQTELGIEVEGENYNRYPTGNTTTLIKGSAAQTRATVNNKIKAVTGFMDKTLVNFFTRELAASEEVYEVTDAQFIKIIVDRKSITDLYTDEDQLTAFSFTYNYAQEEKV